MEDECVQAPVQNNKPLSFVWHKPSGSESTSTTELQNGTCLSILADNQVKSEQADEEDGDVLNYLFSRHSNSASSTYLLRLAREAERGPEVDVAESEFNMSNLVSHRRIHSDEKLFECDVCHKAFKTRHALFRHKRTHSGEKPFKCDICSKRFTQSGSLKNHKLIHTGETPYSCDVCHKAFNRSGTLRKHRLLHFRQNNFVCV